MQNRKPTSVKNSIIPLVLLLNAILVRAGYLYDEKWYSLLVITIPMLLTVLLDVRHQDERTKHRKL